MGLEDNLMIACASIPIDSMWKGDHITLKHWPQAMLANLSFLAPFCQGI